MRNFRREYRLDSLHYHTSSVVGMRDMTGYDTQAPSKIANLHERGGYTKNHTKLQQETQPRPICSLIPEASIYHRHMHVLYRLKA